MVIIRGRRNACLPNLNHMLYVYGFSLYEKFNFIMHYRHLSESCLAMTAMIRSFALSDFLDVVPPVLISYMHAYLLALYLMSIDY